MDESASNTTNSTQNIFDFDVMGQNLSFAKELFRTSVVGIGILLNCLVLLVVICSRQLRYPRHTFWAAVSFFECFVLVEYSLELTVIINRNLLACRALVVISSVDYSLLLLCLSFAAFDRYLSVVHYEWYQVKVTNRVVVVSISIASAVSIFIITSPFWTGYISIYTCTISLTHHYWISSWNLLLGIACVLVHFKTFIETKNLIRQYVQEYRREPITVRFNNHRVRRSNISFGLEEGSTKTTTGGVLMEFPANASDVGHENVKSPGDSQLVFSVDHPIGKKCLPQRQSSSKFNRLEIQTALNMSVNVLPFWLCTFPVSCNAIALYWCIRTEGNCDTIVAMWTYAWDIFMLHGIYNPILYMSTSSEFRRAIIHITRKLMTKSRRLTLMERYGN